MPYAGDDSDDDAEGDDLSYDIDDDPLQYYWSIMPEDSLFALEGIIGDTVVTETAYLEFQSPIRSSEHKFNIKLWVENTSNLFSDEDSLMLTVQILEANDILPDLSSLTLEACVCALGGNTEQ